jgi:hypothetical protein
VILIISMHFPMGDTITSVRPLAKWKRKLHRQLFLFFLFQFELLDNFRALALIVEVLTELLTLILTYVILYIYVICCCHNMSYLAYMTDDI